MVFIALFLTLVTKAQVNPKEGFIITNQKDTVYGMIEYRTNTINAQQCVFKANDASEYVKIYSRTDSGLQVQGKRKILCEQEIRQ